MTSGSRRARFPVSLALSASSAEVHVGGVARRTQRSLGEDLCCADPFCAAPIALLCPPPWACKFPNPSGRRRTRKAGSKDLVADRQETLRAGRED